MSKVKIPDRDDFKLQKLALEIIESSNTLTETSNDTNKENDSQLIIDRCGYNQYGWAEATGRYTSSGDYSRVYLTMSYLDENGGVVDTDQVRIENIREGQTKSWKSETTKELVFTSCSIVIDKVN